MPQTRHNNSYSNKYDKRCHADNEQSFQDSEVFERMYKSSEAKFLQGLADAAQIWRSSLFFLWLQMSLSVDAPQFTYLTVGLRRNPCLCVVW